MAQPIDYLKKINATSEALAILDEEFGRYLEIARSLLKRLKRPDDRAVCARYIQRCCNLSVDNVDVKQNRNKFFKYFLKMLETASEADHEVHFDMFSERKPMLDKKDREITHWSTDNRTYVAAKVIPGLGSLIYMAVSSKPMLGWEECGFTDYKF